MKPITSNLYLLGYEILLVMDEHSVAVGISLSAARGGVRVLRWLHVEEKGSRVRGIGRGGGREQYQMESKPARSVFNFPLQLVNLLKIFVADYITKLLSKLVSFPGNLRDTPFDASQFA